VDIADHPENPPLLVWTSCLVRTLQTAEYLYKKCAPLEKWHFPSPLLNEVRGGIADGLTYEEIGEKFPDVAEGRRKDKLRYRYPSGESYLDVIERVKPVILELERQRGSVLVITHQAVMRVILSYFLQIPQEEMTNIEIPLHTVLQLTPTAYGCDLDTFPLTLEKPSTPKQPGTATTRIPTQIKASKVDTAAAATHVPDTVTFKSKL